MRQPPLPQHEAERDQTEVVLLAGRTGEQRKWATPGTPVAAKGQHSPAQEGGREVLLRDGDLTALPPRADLVQHRQQDAAHDGVDREARDRVVEDRVRVGLVEAVEGSGQPLGMVVSASSPHAGLRDR